MIKLLTYDLMGLAISSHLLHEKHNILSVVEASSSIQVVVWSDFTYGASPTVPVTFYTFGNNSEIPNDRELIYIGTSNRIIPPPDIIIPSLRVPIAPASFAVLPPSPTVNGSIVVAPPYLETQPIALPIPPVGRFEQHIFMQYDKKP